MTSSSFALESCSRPWPSPPSLSYSVDRNLPLFSLFSVTAFTSFLPSIPASSIAFTSPSALSSPRDKAIRIKA
ncbi:hypothetical protein K1719_020312 [Acacia pycnantha]|nr:hypothetical protein K1719_020312 [Acacia pycnantha]